VRELGSLAIEVYGQIRRSTCRREIAQAIERMQKRMQRDCDRRSRWPELQSGRLGQRLPHGPACARARPSVRGWIAASVKETWTILEACETTPLVDRVVLASSDNAYCSQPPLTYREDMASPTLLTDQLLVNRR
jgi:hypothetical protein